MKIVCTGSRHWDDYPTVSATLNYYYQNGMIRIGVGDAAGADAQVRRWYAEWRANTFISHALHQNLHVYNADWSKLGLLAGPARNTRMLTTEKPDLVLAFRSYGKSPGTDNCIRCADSLGIEWKVIMESKK